MAMGPVFVTQPNATQPIDEKYSVPPIATVMSQHQHKILQAVGPLAENVK